MSISTTTKKATSQALTPKKYSDLSQPWQYYCDEPISAIVTIDDDGIVTIKGCTSNWLYGIEPVDPDLQFPHEPYILNRKFKLDF